MIQAQLNETNYSTMISAMLEQIHDRIQLDEIKKYTIQLILWELVSNVIRHSTKKYATVHISWSDEAIVIEVIDGGDGFQWEEKLNAPPPDLASQGGRGLFLVQQLASQFSFDEKGKRAIVVVARNKGGEI
ncbi:ATP-binding protein [Anoxybacillus sp. LAT_35]|uniref:ATP-binding protein n=2 Tax=Anoxybacillaceae TaxID=3120669 RepID=UPI001EDB81CE|nr:MULTISPECIES: ATP-binding protein [unclassified Anoxybacillus]MCG6199288.1 ATP-binding protein [Anoxybacillus sp. LAT_38]MCG6171176.1 ATP-binding protein [Anoxybacillus sp. LAT_11]MCG6176287.1 ATP-binding protein [Anoxybacillus sp. LAT_31]MCG6178727.1 ATP-binding protein [Anoxybacillus sp. LAT_35]MCG6181667.1 ATP-binding protein [Anoxybacillus sp. LAT_33]